MNGINFLRWGLFALGFWAFCLGLAILIQLTWKDFPTAMAVIGAIAGLMVMVGAALQWHKAP